MAIAHRFLALAAAVWMTAAAGTAAAQVQLNFRFNDPEIADMRAAIDEFEKQNPGVKVTIQRASWGDAREQFLRENAVGEGPDVLQTAFVWPRSFAQAGALRPLDDLIAKTGIGVRKDWNDFVARELAVGPDGKRYAIPFTTDTFALMYNKELLGQAGYPALPKDWNGLREASKAVLQKTGKAGWAFPAGSCGTPSIWFFLNYYWWSKGLALIDQGADGKYFMNISPEQIADGFEYYHQYLKDGHNPKAMLAVCLWGAPELVEGMAKGDIAIASVPDPVALQVIKAYSDRNPGKPHPFLTVPHPADVKPPTTHLGGRMVAINSAIKNDKLDAAWKLVQFLTTPGPLFSKYYANYYPAQHSIVSEIKVTPDMQGFPDQMKTARSWGPYGTGPVAIPFMWNATGRAAGSVFIGEKTAKQAGAELHELIGKELAKTQR